MKQFAFTLPFIIALSYLDLISHGYAQLKTDRVHFTSGIKIGEVTDNSVVILTRLCGDAKPQSIRHVRTNGPIREPINFDENMPVDDVDGAVKGAFGQVHIDVVGNIVNEVVLKHE